MGISAAAGFHFPRSRPRGMRRTDIRNKERMLIVPVGYCQYRIELILLGAGIKACRYKTVFLPSGSRFQYCHCHTSKEQHCHPRSVPRVIVYFLDQHHDLENPKCSLVKLCLFPCERGEPRGTFSDEARLDSCGPWTRLEKRLFNAFKIQVDGGKTYTLRSLDGLALGRIVSCCKITVRPI